MSAPPAQAPPSLDVGPEDRVEDKSSRKTPGLLGVDDAAKAEPARPVEGAAAFGSPASNRSALCRRLCPATASTRARGPCGVADFGTSPAPPVDAPGADHVIYVRLKTLQLHGLREIAAGDRVNDPAPTEIRAPVLQGGEV